jgi:thiol-disulfide isomerase/thioredoxin
MRNKAPLLFLAAFAAALFFAVRPVAQDVTQSAKGEPQLIAATFASAFCPACRVLKPKLARVAPAFADAPVEFVEFDYTTGDEKALRAKAEALGVAAIFDAAGGATGYTVLIDAETGAVIDTLTQKFSEGAMKSAIARAVDIATRTDEIASAGGL